MPGLMSPQPPRDVIAPIATMPMDSHSKHLPPGLTLPHHAGSMAALTAMMSSTSAFYLGAAGHNLAAFMPKPAKMPKLDHDHTHQHPQMQQHQPAPMTRPDQPQVPATSQASTTSHEQESSQETPVPRPSEAQLQTPSKEESKDLSSSGGSSRRKSSLK